MHYFKRMQKQKNQQNKTGWIYDTGLFWLPKLFLPSMSLYLPPTLPASPSWPLFFLLTSHTILASYSFLVSVFLVDLPSPFQLSSFWISTCFQLLVFFQTPTPSASTSIFKSFQGYEYVSSVTNQYCLTSTCTPILGLLLQPS